MVLETVVGDRRQPSKIICRIAHMQVGPAHHTRNLAPFEQQVVLVQVTVDNNRFEIPHIGVFHGVLPTAQQGHRDLARAGRLIELVQPSLTELLSRVAG